MNTVITDLTKASEDHYPAKNGFAVGLGFRYSNVSLLDEEMLRYYKVEFLQKVNTNGRDGNSETEWTELEVSKCTSDLFPYGDQDLVNRYGISNYVCAKYPNYVIGGNRYADKEKNLSILISRCSNSTTRSN
jgi:hypothetical protein